MGLKEDSKFARFITMGALGADRIATDLTGRGHHMVELERYAMANKIWTTKVKRLRMADLLCTRCGRRFEAKAKTNLEVKLSHSAQPGRNWDAGMRPGDVFAFLRVVTDENGVPLVIGDPLYLSTGDMRNVEPKQGALKSAADGSERDIYWPITLAKRDGLVTKVKDGKVGIRDIDGKTSTLGRPSNVTLVQVDDLVVAGTLIGSTVVPERGLSCKGDVWDLSGALQSDDEIEVFASVKAIGLLSMKSLRLAVQTIANDDSRDMRLRIEAWGALARLGDVDAVAILAKLDDSPGDGAMQMERVLVLSELTGLNSAAESLYLIASNAELTEEIRAAAVWGLGIAWHDRFSFGWELAFDSSQKVRRHAQASLGVPSPVEIEGLIQELSVPERAPLAAALLAKSESVLALLEAAAGYESREWAIQGLGQISPEIIGGQARQLRIEDQAALEALWRRNIQDTHNEPNNLTELRFLEGQSISAVTSMQHKDRIRLESAG
ncbi:MULTISPECIES: HEAT repeat domain-containing protein [Cryobacterium]|uniref:HEAT repeat domain-containing protein n=1 Tax=Cryobacterium breve TaxID=1259258 RepID=A0ABY2IVP0_9MICO|nr:MULTISPECIES: HEAT repeat domain-containing protein [Cryobacterium]TFC93373.1 hypothetical protein E3T20_10310 [Cryobacterium sp. TmT3-12]TFC95690.1 hypothetical protein E3O65_14435 [Cryobacterium breve]